MSMFKLSENYNREEELKELRKIYNPDGYKESISYGYTKQKLEEKRQIEIKKLLELAETIKNMSIEEYDVYFNTTSLMFESELCDAQDSDFLNGTAIEVGKRYGKNETIYYLTSISNYESADEEDC